jgi:2-iminobutanoate/2-iminopropanoate deaminase
VTSPDAPRKQAVATTAAPGAIGPYSQGIAWDRLVFTSGQLPMDATGSVPSADVRDQARLALANVRAILEAGGSSLDRVLKVTIFVTDMAHFGAINEVYREAFTADAAAFPARSVVQVVALPKAGALLEIEAVGTR